MLLQVHWQRIILDEGHLLGASLAVTNKLQMACALRAECRWIMTGAPRAGPLPGPLHLTLDWKLAIIHHRPAPCLVGSALGKADSALG